MKKIINYFKTAPMTKKLTVIVTGIWLISALGNMIFFAITKTSLNDTMDYIQNAFILTLSSYMVKSGAENILGVKNTNEFLQKVVSVTKQKENNEGNTPMGI